MSSPKCVMLMIRACPCPYTAYNLPLVYNFAKENPVRKNDLRLFIISLTLLCLFILYAPLEKTLGANTRLVFFHGALVWVAIVMFVFAGLTGLWGLIIRKGAIHLWSRGVGHIALLLWLIFLPMSLLVMQMNWNGLFLDEPRFRIPLNFAIIGVLLQLGLLYLPPLWTSATNLLFAIVLMVSLRGAQSVLHPVSPISQSNAIGIQIYFSGIFLLLLIIAGQSAGLWHGWLENRKGKMTH